MTYHETNMSAQRDSLSAHRTKMSSADMVEGLKNAVQENPVAAALIGMGALWLFAGGSRVSLFNAVGNVAREGGDLVSGASSVVSRNVVDAVSSVGGKAREAGASLGDAFSDAAANVAQGMSSALDTTRGAGHAVARSVSDAGATVVSAARQTNMGGFESAHKLGSGLAEMFERQPLLLGAIGLAVGAGIAAAAPVTATETELMGETSRAVKKKAMEMASDQAHAVTGMAERGIEAARRLADQEGLTASTAAQVFREVGNKVQTVSSAAKDAAQRNLK